MACFWSSDKCVCLLNMSSVLSLSILVVIVAGCICVNLYPDMVCNVFFCDSTNGCILAIGVLAFNNTVSSVGFVISNVIVFEASTIVVTCVEPLLLFLIVHL